MEEPLSTEHWSWTNLFDTACFKPENPEEDEAQLVVSLSLLSVR